MLLLVCVSASCCDSGHGHASHGHARFLLFLASQLVCRFSFIGNNLPGIALDDNHANILLGLDVKRVVSVTVGEDVIFVLDRSF